MKEAGVEAAGRACHNRYSAIGSFLQPSLCEAAQVLLDDLQQRFNASDGSAEPLLRSLRLVLIDTMAVAVASLGQPALRRLEQQEHRLSAGSVCLPGMEAPLTAGAAARLVAAAACWDELVEGYAPAHGRPALHVVPVCVALGEALGCSLGEVLKALLQGYELGARFGEAYQVPAGEHVDGTWGTVAATVAASALLNLSHQQRGGAMNAALAQMSRSLYLPVGEGAMSRLLHPGLAASRGMDLSLAAAAGFAGPVGLEHDPVLQSLWLLPPDLQPRPGCAVEAGYVKLLPGARHLHYAAAAALRWRQRQGVVEPDCLLRLCQDSGAIRLRTYREACTYCDQPNPRNRIQAQFSLQFAVAATLLWGEFRPDLFQEERLADPMLKHLLGRIVIEADDDHPGRWAELTLCQPDATEVRELVIGLPGDPHLPITEAERLNKARILMEPALGVERTERVLQHWLEAGLDRALLP